MNKEEVIKLLKRKKVEALRDKDDAIEKHDHNSESNSSYFYGMAAGINVALEIIGMLDKEKNKSSKNETHKDL